VYCTVREIDVVMVCHSENLRVLVKSTKKCVNQLHKERTESASKRRRLRIIKRRRLESIKRNLRAMSRVNRNYESRNEYVLVTI
jgi:hypothetical protein